MNLTRPAVVADVDNTLYNFVDYFGPAFRAMVHVLAKETSLSEDVLYDSFRTVYTSYHSLEYQFSVQKLDVLSNRYDQDEMKRLVTLARIAYGRSQRKQFHAYPNVKETLMWLQQQGFAIIAYTDGPLGKLRSKLGSLGLRSFFDGYVAWVPDPADLENPISVETANEGKWFVKNSLRSQDRLPTISVTEKERKPNQQLLERIVQEFRIDTSRSWYIGDSIVKDLIPARATGFQDVWAKYGKDVQGKNWETLVRISPWHDAVIRTEESKTAAFKPKHVLEDFGELRSIIPRRQLSLFFE
jgi:phosphoglycolate phosphatase